MKLANQLPAAFPRRKAIFSMAPKAFLIFSLLPIVLISCRSSSKEDCRSEETSQNLSPAPPAYKFKMFRIGRLDSYYSVAVDKEGQRVFWIDADANIIATNLADRREIWKLVPAGGERPYGLALYGSRLVVNFWKKEGNSRTFTTAILAAGTGTVILRVPDEGYRPNGPFLIGDRLITWRRAAGEGKTSGRQIAIQALSALTGKVEKMAVLNGELTGINVVGDKLFGDLGLPAPELSSRRQQKIFMMDPASLSILWEMTDSIEKVYLLADNFFENDFGLFHQGDVSLTKYFLEGRPQDGKLSLRQIWKFEIPEKGPFFFRSGSEPTDTDGKTIWKSFGVKPNSISAIDLEKGTEIWRTVLDVEQIASLHYWNKKLLIHSRKDIEFGLAYILDAETGRQLEQVASAAGAEAVFRAGNWFILTTEENDLFAFTPAEKESFSPPGMEERVSAAISYFREYVETRRKKWEAQPEEWRLLPQFYPLPPDFDRRIKAIGSEARPWLRKSIESGNEIEQIAALYGLSMYACASDLPLLHAQFEKIISKNKEEYPRFWIEKKILKTFSRYQYEKVVPLLKKYVHSHEPVTDTDTLAALGSIGSPEALSAYDEFKASKLAPSGPVIRFQEVEPGEFPLSYKGPRPPEVPRPPFLSYTDLIHSQATAVEDAGGTFWVAFYDAMLGGRLDIWVTSRGDGVWKPPLFTGVTGFSLRRDRPAIKMLVNEKGITFKGTFARGCINPEKQGLLRYFECGRPIEDPFVSFEDIRADTDRDGLTDVAEKRLGTNRKMPDTDRDGIIDAEDNEPLAPSGKMPDDDDNRIFNEAYFFLFLDERPGRHELQILDTPLMKVKPRVEGPKGFILNNPDSGRIDELRTLVGFDGFEEVGLSRYMPDSGDPAPAGECQDSKKKTPICYLDKEHSQAEVEIWTYHGGLWSASFYVRLRKHGGRWYVTDFRLHRVS